MQSHHWASWFCGGRSCIFIRSSTPCEVTISKELLTSWSALDYILVSDYSVRLIWHFWHFIIHSGSGYSLLTKSLGKLIIIQTTKQNKPNFPDTLPLLTSQGSSTPPFGIWWSSNWAWAWSSSQHPALQLAWLFALRQLRVWALARLYCSSCPAIFVLCSNGYNFCTDRFIVNSLSRVRTCTSFLGLFPRWVFLPFPSANCLFSHSHHARAPHHLSGSLCSLYFYLCLSDALSSQTDTPCATCSRSESSTWPCTWTISTCSKSLHHHFAVHEVGWRVVYHRLDAGLSISAPNSSYS